MTWEQLRAVLLSHLARCLAADPLGALSEMSRVGLQTLVAAIELEHAVHSVEDGLPRDSVEAVAVAHQDEVAELQVLARTLGDVSQHRQQPLGVN